VGGGPIPPRNFSQTLGFWAGSFEVGWATRRMRAASIFGKKRQNRLVSVSHVFFFVIFRTLPPQPLTCERAIFTRRTDFKVVHTVHEGTNLPPLLIVRGQSCVFSPTTRFRGSYKIWGLGMSEMAHMGFGIKRKRAVIGIFPYDRSDGSVSLSLPFCS